MLSLRLNQLFVCFGLIFFSLTSFASPSILNIFVENQSKNPYTLIIYGTGSSYEIVEAFDTLSAKETGTVRIDYQLSNKETRKDNSVYHILLLNSDSNCCKVEYTAHPAHHSQYHFFKSNKFKSSLNSFNGPCKAWKESEDTLHVILIEPES